MPKKGLETTSAVAKNKNVVATFPNNMAMAGDGNRKVDKDLKRRQKCELNTVIRERKKKREDLAFNRSPLNQDSLMSSQPRTDSSSLSSESSFVFIESESSFLECKYDKLKEESDATSKHWEAESQKKILLGESVESFTSHFTEPGSKTYATVKGTSSIPNPDRSQRKRMIHTFVGENQSISAGKHSGANGNQEDRSGNSSEKNDGTLSLPDGEDQMIELREALEHSTNCLLRCLQRLKNKPLKQEELNLDECNTIPRPDRNTSKCKCSKDNFMTSIKESKEGITSNSSSSNSHTLKNNSITSGEQCTEAFITSASRCYKVENSLSKETQVETIILENCVCDCCNGRCRHPQKHRGDFNGSLSKDAKRPKKKLTPHVLKKGFSRGNISKKEMNSVTSEAKENIVNNSSSVLKPNAARTLLLKNETASRKRTNVNKTLKHEDYSRRSDMKSKIVANCSKNDEQEQREENKQITEDDKDDGDLIKILFISFLAFFGFFLGVFLFQLDSVSNVS